MSCLRRIVATRPVLSAYLTVIALALAATRLAEVTP